MENVQVGYAEDFEGSYQVVTCSVCGCDVSEEYEEAYGQEDDDYDSSKEFQAEEGWWP